MTKKYDALVFIGRMQPLHLAHHETFQHAATLTDKLIVVIGSAYQPRTYKNPFTYQERSSMVHDVAGEMFSTLAVEPCVDYIYNDQAWVIRVQEIVAKHTKAGEKIGIIGHKKDGSSYYLDMFPQWDFIETDLIEPLNATDVRDLYFRNDCNMRYIDGVVPATVSGFLRAFAQRDEYQYVIEERQCIEKYKKQFEHLPYPSTFVTTDAVVVQNGHVLLVERKHSPGKGLLALPGGFLNQNERIVDGIIRELREETGIKVPEAVLRGSIKKVEVFDHPTRSERGRTITHAALIELDDEKLPKVKGMDDAKRAIWKPIGELDSSVLFEDHMAIISYLLRIG